MSILGFWDWDGNCKLVDFGGYVVMCGQSVTPSIAAAWWYEQQGRRPDIRSAYAISYEFYEEWKDRYAAKGMLCEGEDGGEM